MTRQTNLISSSPGQPAPVSGPVRTETEGATEAIAEFVSSLEYEAIPDAVADRARYAILDTLGVALAGAAAGEGFQEAIAFALAQESAPRARIWASGERLSAGLAAFSNTLHARALDYDDITEFPQVHVAVCVVPAALAVAEAMDRPVSGKTLISAVVAGSELQTRLAASIAPARPCGPAASVSDSSIGPDTLPSADLKEVSPRRPPTL